MNDVLVVADHERAQRVAAAWRALALSETLDEALARLPEPYRSRVDELRAGTEDEGDPEPDREALHDWALDGGIEWLQQEMLTDLPDDVAALGEQSLSDRAGPCLLIPASRRDDVIAALRAGGHEVVEDDELVWLAGPYGYDSARA